jgi:hypothetical protein
VYLRSQRDGCPETSFSSQDRDGHSKGFIMGNLIYFRSGDRPTGYLFRSAYHQWLRRTTRRSYEGRAISVEPMMIQPVRSSRRDGSRSYRSIVAESEEKRLNSAPEYASCTLVFSRLLYRVGGEVGCMGCRIRCTYPHLIHSRFAAGEWLRHSHSTRYTRDSHAICEPYVPSWQDPPISAI